MNEHRSSPLRSELRKATAGQRWWLLLGTALAAVTLCSCQLTPRPATGLARGSDAAVPPVAALPAASHLAATMPPAPPVAALPAGPTAVLAGEVPAAAYGVQLAAYAPVGLPGSAWTGQPGADAAPGYGPDGTPGCSSCPPAFEGAAPPPGSWRPPGISGRWPYNEYLCDGGDQGAQVEVMRDWSVWGLDQEDTVAHYDTIDGRTEVQASNPVCLYAPRFAAVRQVSGVLAHEVHDRLAGVSQPVQPNVHEERGVPTTMLQPVEPGRYVGSDGPQIFRDRARGESTTGRQLLAKFDSRFWAHEDFQLIRNGTFDNSEKARLAERLDAAAAWTDNQAVQVAIDHVTAIISTGDVNLQSVYRYDLPAGKPRVRVVKVASKRAAQPGDEVDFTIRFDNIGDQTVGNVTIADSLTTRLEYIPDTAQCDREANFGTQRNDGESLVLRWEIRSPLQVGEGGVIRFKCRVR